MLSEEMRTILDMKNDGQIIFEISKALGVKYCEVHSETCSSKTKC